MDNLKNVLTDSDIKRILCKHTKVTDFKILSHTIGPLSKEIQGHVGQHFILTINYMIKDEESILTLFLKVLNPRLKTAFEMAMSIDAYIKEELLYTLQEEYKKLKIDTTFAPSIYFNKPYAFVLEDLSKLQYKLVYKKDLFDLAHIKKALECLAKFHASSIIYEEIKSRALGKKYCLLDEFSIVLQDKLFARDGNKGAEWFKASINGFIVLIDKLDEKRFNKNNFKAKLLEVYSCLPVLVQPSSIYRNVICHGDLWTNNIMFTYENTLPVEAKLVDYQLLKYGPLAIDVIQMIATDCRKLLRDQHLEEMLDCYYSQLKTSLANHCLDINTIVPRFIFDKSIKEMQVPIRLQTLANHSITFMDNDVLIHVLQDDERKNRFLFEDRSKYLIQSFEDNPQFREIILEDLEDLYFYMFKVKYFDV